MKLGSELLTLSFIPPRQVPAAAGDCCDLLGKTSCPGSSRQEPAAVFLFALLESGAGACGCCWEGRYLVNVRLLQPLGPAPLGGTAVSPCCGVVTVVSPHRGTKACEGTQSQELLP